MTSVLYFLLCSFCFGVIIARKLDTRETKIVGGAPVAIEDVPYQASLRYLGSHLCGATVVSERFLVTAAHCVYPSIIAALYQIRVGTDFINEGGEYYDIEEAYINSNYTGYDMDYDVAVIKLSSSLQFNDKVKALPVADADLEIPDGSFVDVVGWGNTAESGWSSRTLLRVAVPTVGTESCAKAYRNYFEITPRMLCAGAEEGGLDACQGDSGGGLTFSGQLAGIVSFGVGCARPEYPGVYTRVSAVSEWIAKTIKDNS